MAVNDNDIRREEETDKKVGVAKDLHRIANGDVAGTLRDDIDEMKADIKAVDDKIEKPFSKDDRDDRFNQ
jgi:hypothetical protein